MGKFTQPRRLFTFRNTFFALIALLLLGTWSNARQYSSNEYAMRRSVKLMNDQGSCSGEQVRGPSGVNYILSAAHCRKLEAEDHTILVTTEDGFTLRRKVLAEDPFSDLLLIEGLPALTGLNIAETSEALQHVRTFTHGRGLDTYETEGVLIQNTQVNMISGIVTEESQCALPKNRIIMSETPFGMAMVCTLDLQEMVTTAKIVPGSSGGMVVDDSGALVGVASATDRDGSFGYLVRLKDIREFLSGY